MASALYEIVICVFASLCYYILVNGFLKYKKMRMWQTKGQIVKALVTAKWKVIYTKAKWKENQFFISYSFYHHDTEYEVDRVELQDESFWHSIIVNTSLEVIYIIGNPKRYNQPLFLLENRCKECGQILTSAAFSCILFFSALIISVAICHYKWDEILFIMFVYPGLILILFALSYLCWNGNKRNLVHPEMNSLIHANNIRVQVY